MMNMFLKNKVYSSLIILAISPFLSHGSTPSGLTISESQKEKIDRSITTIKELFSKIDTLTTEGLDLETGKAYLSMQEIESRRKALLRKIKKELNTLELLWSLFPQTKRGEVWRTYSNLLQKYQDMSSTGSAEWKKVMSEIQSQLDSYYDLDRDAQVSLLEKIRRNFDKIKSRKSDLKYKELHAKYRDLVKITSKSTGEVKRQ